jgi:hypothetical protein
MSTWHEPKTDWQEGQIVSEADMNEIGANLGYLFGRPMAVGTLENNATTASETMSEIHNDLKVSLNIRTGRALAGFSGFCVAETGTPETRMELVADGNPLYPSVGNFGFNATSTWFTTIAFTRMFAGLSVGVHQFAVRWRVASSSTEIRLHGDHRAQLWVVEI